jgi:hypothetical protein
MQRFFHHKSQESAQLLGSGENVALNHPAQLPLHSLRRDGLPVRIPKVTGECVHALLGSLI